MRWQLCSPWLVGTDGSGLSVIGLTGSNGKTTTKELMKCVLEAAHSHVHATVGNFNNHIGVPLTLLAARTNPTSPSLKWGPMRKRNCTARPNRRAQRGRDHQHWRAHLEGFGGEEGVMKGKGELFDFIRMRSECPCSQRPPQTHETFRRLNRHEYGTPSTAPFVSEVHAEDAVPWVGPSGAPTDR